MKTIFADPERSVVENLGLLLRQLLPETLHPQVPRLIGRLAGSYHVSEHLSRQWDSLTSEERQEIEREINVLTGTLA